MNPKLIYDVGMHNGDDTAYYLRRGFRVVAIEPNPALVATASERFRREIEAGELKILNVGVAAEDREVPFWVCLIDSRLSSLYHDASLDDRYPVEEIRVPCRTFRSILDEFGVPFYLKVDIQGNDSLCVEALDPGDVPKFLSIEFALWDAPLMALMRARGFNRFKYISQTHFLPAAPARDAPDPARGAAEPDQKYACSRVSQARWTALDSATVRPSSHARRLDFSGWQLGALRRRVARPLAQPRRTVRDSSGIFAAAPRRSANLVVGISRTRLQSVLGRLACSIRLEREQAVW